MKTSTVFLVDDDKSFLRSTKRLFESEKLPVVAFPSGEDFLEQYQAGQPGCLLLDLMMPGLSGLDVLRHLRSQEMNLPTIVMTAFGDIPSAVQAMKLGALDFIEKPIHSDRELMKLVRRLLQQWSSPQLAESERQGITQRLRDLTEREREILERVVDGLSSKEIANEFGLSLATVNSHRTRILEKMQVGSLPNLISLMSRYRYAHTPPANSPEAPKKRR